MILFQVSTHFQLICAIIVKMQMLNNEKADLHLDDFSDFSGIIDNLKLSRLFCHIEQSNQIEKVTQIRENMINMGKLLTHPIPNIWNFQHEDDYTDIYFGHDMHPNKMYYYYLVDKGKRPDIHILDEGMTAYYKNIKLSAENDFIDHKKYGKRSYIENIKEQLLFNPQLYCWENTKWNVVKIPHINEQTKEIILSIYGNPRLDISKEPYVYLATGGYEKGFFSNEIDLLHLLADTVGKENIIIKQHPRYTSDPYTKFGFKVWTQSTKLPWEVILFANDFSNQIFVTIFSNAVLSPFNLMGTNKQILFLYRMFMGTNRFGVFGNNVKKSIQYLSKINDSLNETQKFVYCPNTNVYLEEILRYIEGIRKVGGAV